MTENAEIAIRKGQKEGRIAKRGQSRDLSHVQISTIKNATGMGSDDVAHATYAMTDHVTLSVKASGMSGIPDPTDIERQGQGDGLEARG